MRVEFMGIARERAGTAEVTFPAATLGQMLAMLSTRFPMLGDIVNGERLQPAFVANLNGDRFVSDPATPLVEDDSVLILSADAGG
ncbi:MAG: MoaD/ThiS family protein [Acidobacteria bacterium]|nr:MoaD/ThiS family protein [Acidobacteriota bacterium]